MPKLSKTFIENVEKQLKVRDMNRARLAEAMGLAKPNITQLLRKETNPKLSMIERIAHALGVQPWELLRPPGAEPAPQVREHDLAECYRRVQEDAARGRERLLAKKRAANTGADAEPDEEEK